MTVAKVHQAGYGVSASPATGLARAVRRARSALLSANAGRGDGRRAELVRLEEQPAQEALRARLVPQGHAVAATFVVIAVVRQPIQRAGRGGGDGGVQRRPCHREHGIGRYVVRFDQRRIPGLDTWALLTLPTTAAAAVASDVAINVDARMVRPLPASGCGETPATPQRTRLSWSCCSTRSWSCWTWSSSCWMTTEWKRSCPWSTDRRPRVVVDVVVVRFRRVVGLRGVVGTSWCRQTSSSSDLVAVRRGGVVRLGRVVDLRGVAGGRRQSVVVDAAGVVGAAVLAVGVSTARGGIRGGVSTSDEATACGLYRQARSRFLVGGCQREAFAVAVRSLVVAALPASRRPRSGA